MSNIVGIVRYSVGGEFNRVQNPFEPEYFEYRYKIFNEFTIKSFVNQTDKDFTLLVFHSSAMPENQRQRFIKLEKQYPFIRVFYVASVDDSGKIGHDEMYGSDRDEMSRIVRENIDLTGGGGGLHSLFALTTMTPCHAILSRVCVQKCCRVM